jgi:8-oxo-dGTP pyrophosphatase MutT (NUDIX family)
MAPKSAETRLAATIMLLRDGSDLLEVFMVERHHKIDFAEGALVFPGGKVETSDGTQELVAFCRSADSDSPDENTVRVAAIRETFEECGVLLARPRGAPDLVDGVRLESLATSYRDRLQNGDLSMLDMVRAEELELAFDLLVPFESVDSLWTTIPRALELEKTGQRTIIFPTLENMKKLGRSRSVEDALENARRDTIVTVLPRFSKDPDGTLMMVIPEEAGYDTVRAPMPGPGGGQKAVTPS